jgi:simple sugar transport system substrate-binding protein
MHRLTIGLGAAIIGLGLTGGAQAQAPLNIAFTIHSSPSNTFWQAVKKGFDDACQKVQANCQMIFTQTEGSIAEQQANMQTALAANPDALITSIVDNSAFDELIKGARDKGILVIATNVDDTEGAKGSARQAFIGQGFIPAGYTLAKAQSANFPAEGPIHVLVGM